MTSPSTVSNNLKFSFRPWAKCIKICWRHLNGCTRQRVENTYTKNLINISESITKIATKINGASIAKRFLSMTLMYTSTYVNWRHLAAVCQVQCLPYSRITNWSILALSENKEKYFSLSLSEAIPTFIASSICFVSK